MTSDSQYVDKALNTLLEISEDNTTYVASDRINAAVQLLYYFAPPANDRLEVEKKLAQAIEQLTQPLK